MQQERVRKVLDLQKWLARARLEGSLSELEHENCPRSRRCQRGAVAYGDGGDVRQRSDAAVCEGLEGEIVLYYLDRRRGHTNTLRVSPTKLRTRKGDDRWQQHRSPRRAGRRGKLCILPFADGASRQDLSSQIRAVCNWRGGRGTARDRREDPRHSRRVIPGYLRENRSRRRRGDCLEAAFGAGSGVIAIAGTGSMRHGRESATGNVARAGGWGFAISDEGFWPLDRPPGHRIGDDGSDEGLETALTDGILQAWKFNTSTSLCSVPTRRHAGFPATISHRPAGRRWGRRDCGRTADRTLHKLAALAAIVVRRLAPAAEGGSPPAPH